MASELHTNRFYLLQLQFLEIKFSSGFDVLLDALWCLLMIFKKNLLLKKVTIYGNLCECYIPPPLSDRGLI